MITEEHQDIITSMNIDEERDQTPYRDDSRCGNKLYTDHNMIMIEMNLQIKIQKE